MNRVTKVLGAGKLLLALALVACGVPAGTSELGSAGAPTGGAPASAGSGGVAGTGAHAGSAGIADQGGAAGVDSAGAAGEGGEESAGAPSGNGGGGQATTGGAGSAGGLSGGNGGSSSGGSAGQTVGGAGGSAGAAACECKKYPSDPSSSQCCDGCHFLPAMTFIAEAPYSATCSGNKIQVTYRNEYCEGDSGYKFVWGDGPGRIGPNLACSYLAGSSDPYFTGINCTENAPGNAVCAGQ